MRTANLLGLIVCVSCSWVARDEPPTGCEVDDDCQKDEICSVDQGGVCLPKASPPRRALAFRLQEGQEFVAELHACEMGFDQGNVTLKVDRDDIDRRFELAAEEQRPGEADPCTVFSCPEGYECDSEANACVAAFPSEVTLTQASRLGRATVTSENKTYPILDEMMLPLEDRLSFDWAAYSFLEGEGPPILVRIEAADEKRARVKRKLRSNADQTKKTFDIATRFQCHQHVHGLVRRFGGGPVLGANVSLAHDEPVASPSSILSGDGPQECSKHSDCGQGEACNETLNQCGLDLTGEPAGEASSADTGSVDPYVYIYCDEGPAFERSFVVEVVPTDVSGLPQMRYTLVQDIEPPLTGDNPPPTADMPGDLCIPDWPIPSPVTIEIGAPPVTLVTTEDGDLKCCDANCLSGGQVLPSEIPQAPESCTTFERFSLSTPVPVQDPNDWEAEGCLPFYVDDDGNVGSFARSLSAESECNESLCTVNLPLDLQGEDPRQYAISVVHPPGSVFRSTTLTGVEIDPFTMSIEPVLFSPRTILKGEITCADDTENCDATGATIVAERLRMPEEGGPPGPFFYHQVAYATSEDDDGVPRGARFALPVNPGVYVVTALPAPGSGGGPARYSIIDLRNSAFPDEEGNVKVLELEDPIELEGGAPVRLQLEDFDRSAKVQPIDTGSWFRQEGFTLPGSEDGVDLNDPNACYHSDDPNRGCEIRKLTRPDVEGLSQLQGGRVVFTTRDRGAKDCPSG
jgi:hypothetical protein